MYGPNGIGILCGRRSLLDSMVPCRFGGEMVDTVTLKQTDFNKLPYKFEAGTPNYIGAIGLASAVEYLENIGMEHIEHYEKDLYAYTCRMLSKIHGLQIIYQNSENKAIISFLVDKVHPFDLSTLLDKMGIAVRAGSHCAQPAMAATGIESTIRVSLAFYNTFEEIDLLSEGIKKAIAILRG